MCDLWLLVTALALLLRCFAAKLSSLCLISYVTVAPEGRSHILLLEGLLCLLLISFSGLWHFIKDTAPTRYLVVVYGYFVAEYG